jgi:hypothetical protein
MTAFFLKPRTVFPAPGVAKYVSKPDGECFRSFIVLNPRTFTPESYRATAN